jgi:Restriction alleviation protein Lar
MGDVKLLPCPWCTEAAQIVNRKRYRKYVVLCDNADCFVRPSTPECDAEAEAIAAWNNRPALTPAQQAAEEMVSVLRGLAGGFAMLNSTLDEGQLFAASSVAKAMSSTVDDALAKAGKP